MSALGKSTEADALGKPVGVGVGVGFIWALAGQMLTSVCLELLFGPTGFSTKVAHTGQSYVMAIGYFVAMAILIVIGDALRLGQQWAWWVIVVLTGALTVAGLVMLPFSINRIFIHHGNAWSLWAQIILVTLAPFIFYRMVQPVTRNWYAHVSVAVARARHSAPSWFAFTLASAAIGGFLTAFFERLA